ncbi:MAG: FG-GAP-like repeat-containing protein, partial [Ignavibacteria bacterium]
MDKLYSLQVKFSILSFFFLTVNSYAYLTGSNTKPLTQNGNVKTIQSSDSLPKGVTQDWLNSLKDEYGKAVLSDDEGDAFQRKIFNGHQANSQFGYSISSAGDVNGDGYDDIIVGAPYYNTNAGRAYIYFGGLIMNTVADLIFTGSANDFLGNAVSSAGDVNGDGYSDVIVGANGYSSNSGRVYIYFGGAVMNIVADVTITGGAVNLNLGAAVSTAGDVNGDGYSDVIVGSFGLLSNMGVASIYYGGSSMNNVPDVTMIGEAAGNFFGISVSSAGDVNGDGYSDAIVGAYGHNSNIGRTYIFFGGAPMNGIADLILSGEAVSNFFGFSASTAGDVNGDGYSDVIVGAYGNSSNTGRAYIFYGGASMNNIPDVIMSGEASGNQFGRSVSEAGDINGDGYSDIIVGAWNYFSATGRSYIYFGGILMNSITDVTINGEATTNQFGWSVSSAGDVNGDGYSDLVIGANGYSGTTGRVYVFDYFLKNEIVQDYYMTGASSNDRFGLAISSADVNGDGYSDVIVGASGFSGGKGRVYIYLGGDIQDTVADITMAGTVNTTRIGHSVSSAGDLNGDGYSDVIIGMFGGSLAYGNAYILFGGISMDSIVDVTLYGETSSSQFGASVSGAGDVNGDGYSDVIVGANNFSPDGKAYIYFGGATMDSIADVTLLPEASSITFGISVSTAGDINGDGYSDVIVSSAYYSSFMGRIYVYFGGSSMDTIA